MSTSDPPLTNGHAPSAGPSQHSDPLVPPPEIEATLSRLSAYRNVRGVMILSRPTPSSPPGGSAAPTSAPGGIVQSTGPVFEGESGKTYAAALHSVVEGITRAVGECDPGDELKFMRVRTKRHELIITPDERYVLVVLQDPGQ